MRNLIALTTRELRSAFHSPVAWAVILFFLLFPALWLFYAQQFFIMDQATLRPYFAIFPLAYTLIIPALTMRSWAEERRQGTVELLFSFPVSELTLVVSKFLSSCIILAIALAVTVPLPLSLQSVGDFEWGVIFSEYVGSLLLGASALALGQFASSLAKNQISAYLLALIALFFVTSLNQISLAVRLPDLVSSFLNSLCLSFHYERFTKGVIDVRDVGWYAVFTALFLYLTRTVLVIRKWR